MASGESLKRYYLLDGIQLRADEHEQFERLAAIRVYADLGETAARTGPILLEHDTVSASLVAAIDEGRPRRYAVAELLSRASLTALGRHLLASRYLQLNEYSQHFLRYADTRVFSALVQVLTAAQLSMLFGPVENWRYLDRAGQTTAQPRPPVPSASGTIRLDQAQQRQLFRLAAPDQLLAEVLADEPELADRGSESELHFWTASSLEFLEQQRMRSFPLRLAVATVAVRTRGQALDDAAFVALVVHSFSRGTDVDALYDWNPTEARP